MKTIIVKIGQLVYDQFRSTSEYKIGQTFIATIFQEGKMEDVVVKIDSINKVGKEVILNCRII